MTSVGDDLAGERSCMRREDSASDGGWKEERCGADIVVDGADGGGADSATCASVIDLIAASLVAMNDAKESTRFLSWLASGTAHGAEMCKRFFTVRHVPAGLLVASSIVLR